MKKLILTGFIFGAFLLISSPFLAKETNLQQQATNSSGSYECLDTTHNHQTQEHYQAHHPNETNTTNRNATEDSSQRRHMRRDTNNVSTEKDTRDCHQRNNR